MAVTANMYSPILVFLLCLTALAVDAGSNDNLVAVIQLFRHGQRTPFSFFKSDAYADSSNWAGLTTGQLTNEGKRQQYALGQFTRRRYADWLPKKYSKDDFYAQSTDVDRTHMSAQSNIYGLYPASGTQMWRKKVDWQPIPIHPVDPHIMPVTAPYSCAAYTTERNNLLANDSTYIEIDAKYDEVYKYLTKYIGENITFPDTHKVYDGLKIESDVGFALPSWASAVFPSPLEDLAAYYFESYSHSTKLKRLGSGPLLYKWLEYFEAMKEDPTSKPKFQMYSGHDFNIASILNSLGGYDPPFPPEFACSLYLELRKKSCGTYYVTAWRKNGDDMEQFSIHGCDLDCPLTQVKSRLADILVDADTRDSEC